MFLSMRMHALRRDERGSTILAVVGVMAVTSVIGATVAAATLNGLGFTSSTRASVQARAAAEAGIDVAVVGLQTSGSCAATTAVYQSTIAPAYRATIEYDAGSGWVAGCPIETATQVRIVSTGDAQASAAAGATPGNTRVIEAVYNYIPDYVEIPQIDAAVYAHTIQGDLKNFELVSADNSLAADVQIKNGNVNCLNGARIVGDLILGNGFANLRNCAVTGSIHVSQYVFMDGGSHVNGDVLAAASGVMLGSDAITLKGGSTVDGNIYAGGNVSVLSSSASVAKGNVTVAGNASSVATVASGSTIMGNLISSGTVVVKGAVQGTVSSAVEGLQPPPAPLIPNWTDIPYPSPAWAANGYEEVLWAGGCTVSNGDAAWAALSTRTTPTVVNALGCGADGITTSSTVDSLSLKANIAFVAHKFNINKLYAASSDTTSLNLWFIVPDNRPDGLPTCIAPSGDIYLHNEADIQPTVSAMVYTPCKIYSDRDGWRGQLYGGEVEFGQQAKLTFVPVGVPGVSFSGDDPPEAVLNGGHLGNRVSLRDLASGG